MYSLFKKRSFLEFSSLVASSKTMDVMSDEDDYTTVPKHVAA